MPRLARALAATALILVAFTGTANAVPYTKEFRGEGSSGFGFAWYYARAHAAQQARDDGFTQPLEQCEETDAWGNMYDAWVIWECTR
jgi:hypothetical protein